MKNCSTRNIVLLAVLFVISVSAAAGDVKNVIYLIGDGMGPNHTAYARHQVVGKDGKLNMEHLPVIGVVKTHSADKLITDSAAAGTALACGIKTNKGMIGMDPKGVKYYSLLELLAHKGWATGVAATSQVSHATPAAFASHVKSRNQQAEIAEQMLENRLDVMFGGGLKYWLARADKRGARDDGANLVNRAISYGYAVIEETDELLQLDKLPAVGLFANDGMKTDDSEPTLAQMSKKAIELLDKKDENGFFLMIEGSQIDWAGHGNNDKKMIHEMNEFDLAVKEAVDFAKKDGNTLVIVTSDHETGGLIILEESSKAVGTWATGGHSAGDVLLYAMGPGSGDFAGVMDNTEVPKKIADLTGIEDFPVKMPDKKHKP